MWTTGNASDPKSGIKNIRPMASAGYAIINEELKHGFFSRPSAILDVLPGNLLPTAKPIEALEGIASVTANMAGEPARPDIGDMTARG